MTDESKKKEKPSIQVLRKIPIFQGLSASQVKKILDVCTPKSCVRGDVVCRSGTDSDEMYLLLSGEAAVVTTDGLKVATILPVTTVGEMGVITGQPRSATVEVTKPSVIFTIRKAPFEAALKSEADLQIKVYRAIIDELSAKLNNQNLRMRDHQMEIDREKSQITLLKRNLLEQEQRTVVAIDVAAESSGREADELALHIDDRVKHLTPRVLVVDGDVESRKLVRDALPDYEVFEAESDQKALDVIQEELLDLVITDLTMPEMNGIELLKLLRVQYPDLKVIGVSGYMKTSDVKANFDFDDFVEKPFELHQFQDTVNKQLFSDE